MFYSYKNRKNNVIDSMFPKKIKIGYAMYKKACIKNKRKNSKKITHYKNVALFSDFITNPD